MTNCKVVARKGCSDMWDVLIGRIGAMSHHLPSILGVIEFNHFVYSFVCKVGYIDAQIRESLLHR